MQPIQSFLWFDNNAEEAVNFYVSVFPKARIVSVFHSPEGGTLPAGSVLTVDFEIGGVRFAALNGGPGYPFNHAISFVVPCESQAEIDEYWGKLTAGGGKEVACGWLVDKFGVSWQVVPHNITQLLAGKDAEGGKRAFAAMMQMKKLDMAALARAGGLA